MGRYVSLLSLVLLIVQQSDAFTPSSSTRISSNHLLHSSQRRATFERSALLDPSIVTSTSILTQDSIHQAFSVATFFPQPFWLLLILIPNTGLTKKVMGGMGA